MTDLTRLEKAYHDAAPGEAKRQAWRRLLKARTAELQAEVEGARDAEFMDMLEMAEREAAA